MKIKYDFVTNSSSCSYIIGTKTKINIIKNSIEYDLLKSLLKKFHILNSIKELNLYFEKEYGDDYIEDPSIVKYYNQCFEIINNSGSIIIANIEYGFDHDFPGGVFKKYNPIVIMRD